MAAKRIALCKDDRVEVVVTTDPAITATWSEPERGRYMLLGERPDGPLPAAATRFVLRPLLWFERRKERDTISERFDPRGVELLEGYIDAMRQADNPGQAGKAFRDGIEPGDRELLSQTMVASMHADEALCQRCVVEVAEGSAREQWSDLLMQLHVEDATQTISQVARHIRRISGLGPKQAF